MLFLGQESGRVQKSFSSCISKPDRLEKGVLYP